MNRLAENENPTGKLYRLARRAFRRRKSGVSEG